jgi:tRNA(Arg) A34 adenosine deaminase TadA
VLANPHLNHRVEVTAGILADEAEALMQEFFSARR